MFNESLPAIPCDHWSLINDPMLLTSRRVWHLLSHASHPFHHLFDKTVLISFQSKLSLMTFLMNQMKYYILWYFISHSALEQWNSWFIKNYLTKIEHKMQIIEAKGEWNWSENFLLLLDVNCLSDALIWCLFDGTKYINRFAISLRISDSDAL